MIIKKDKYVIKGEARLTIDKGDFYALLPNGKKLGPPTQRETVALMKKRGGGAAAVVAAADAFEKKISGQEKVTAYQENLRKRGEKKKMESQTLARKNAKLAREEKAAEMREEREQKREDKEEALLIAAEEKERIKQEKALAADEKKRAAFVKTKHGQAVVALEEKRHEYIRQGGALRRQGDRIVAEWKATESSKKTPKKLQVVRKKIDAIDKKMRRIDALRRATVRAKEKLINDRTERLALAAAKRRARTK